MTEDGPKEHPEDQWLVDGHPAFGTIPGGVLSAAPEAAPIYLHRGTNLWGQQHIWHDHQVWVARQKVPVPELVWRKCQQPGKMYLVPDVAHKLNISLTLSPSALLVLRYMPNDKFYRVVTLYYKDKPLDESDFLGRYAPNHVGRTTPTFTLEPRRQVQVTYKPARKTYVPG